MKSARLNRRSKRGKHGGGWMAGHLHGGGSAGRETGRTENRITTPSRRSVVGLDAGSEAGAGRYSLPVHGAAPGSGPRGLA
jgi:hypothetical protein